MPSFYSFLEKKSLYHGTMTWMSQLNHPSRLVPRLSAGQMEAKKFSFQALSTIGVLRFLSLRGETGWWAIFIKKTLLNIFYGEAALFDPYSTQGKKHWLNTLSPTKAKMHCFHVEILKWIRYQKWRISFIFLNIKEHLFNGADPCILDLNEKHVYMKKKYAWIIFHTVNSLWAPRISQKLD